VGGRAWGIAYNSDPGKEDGDGGRIYEGARSFTYATLAKANGEVNSLRPPLNPAFLALWVWIFRQEKSGTLWLDKLMAWAFSKKTGDF
jgi:hypothetical protein